MKPAFTPVPEIHLPSGQIVPAFEVSTFLCGKRVVPNETPDAEPRVVWSIPKTTWRPGAT
jgi:hypothetical protein